MQRVHSLASGEYRSRWTDHFGVTVPPDNQWTLAGPLILLTDTDIAIAALKDVVQIFAPAD